MFRINKKALMKYDEKNQFLSFYCNKKSLINLLWNLFFPLIPSKAARVQSSISLIPNLPHNDMSAEPSAIDILQPWCLRSCGRSCTIKYRTCAALTMFFILWSFGFPCVANKEMEWVGGLLAIVMSLLILSSLAWNNFHLACLHFDHKLAFIEP